MPFIITKKITTIAGDECEEILHKCPDSGNLKFLQHFQSRLAIEIYLITYNDVVNFLHENKLLIGGNEIFYNSNAVELQYFGTLKEV